MTPWHHRKTEERQTVRLNRIVCACAHHYTITNIPFPTFTCNCSWIPGILLDYTSLLLVSSLKHAVYRDTGIINIKQVFLWEENAPHLGTTMLKRGNHFSDQDLKLEGSLTMEELEWGSMFEGPRFILHLHSSPHSHRYVERKWMCAWRVRRGLWIWFPTRIRKQQKLTKCH